MRMLSKALTMTVISASAIGVFAVPASATTNTGTTTVGVTNTAGHIAGVCIAYGANINLVTVYNPLSPASALVIVSAPVVTGVKAC